MKPAAKIPATPYADNKYRWIENGHIFLWLIKDTCWAMELKPGGLFMILPTVSVALYLLWRSRNTRSELYHNIAVCLWIGANSVWMAGEFFDMEARPYAAVLFVTGLLTLTFYYIVYFKKDSRTDKAAVSAIPNGDNL